MSAFFASVVSIFLTTANVYDLLGDYNQTASLLGIILAFFTVKFVQTDTSNNKYNSIFWAGFILGLMFLTKQTIFVATGLIHIVVLTVYCICRKDEKTIWYFIFVIIGMMIPIILTFIYLGLNGVLIPFIEQVFLNVDEKKGYIKYSVCWCSFRSQKNTNCFNNTVNCNAIIYCYERRKK